MHIGILSDTHGFFDPLLREFFKHCDELWHAGDWGNMECVKEIEAFKPVRGVYGNIDSADVRITYPELNEFIIEGLHVCMLHIGGYPGHYSPQFRNILKQKHKIDIMLCGHSHILKVMRDEQNKLMHFNPGAAGLSGFHKFSTALRLKIENKRIFDLEVWEKRK